MMKEQLHLFRPGEERRRLPRMQFDLQLDGKCSAFYTYPIPGFPWRHNPVRIGSWEIDKDLALRLFDEMKGLPAKFPDSCLSDGERYSDRSEKANGVARDWKTNTLCYSMGVVRETGDFAVRFSMRETDKNLLGSTLFRVVSELTASLEAYQPWKRSEQPGDGYSPPAAQSSDFTP